MVAGNSGGFMGRKPALTSVSPFQYVNSLESLRNSSQVLGNFSRLVGIPFLANKSWLNQMAYGEPVSGSPQVLPRNWQLARAEGGQYLACEYCETAIIGSSCITAPRTPSVTGLSQ